MEEKSLQDQNCISEASVSNLKTGFEKAAKAVDKHNKAKANAYVEEDGFMDDEIPPF